MQVLLDVIRPDPARPPSPELLLRPRLQSGQQGRQPSPLAGQAREPGYFHGPVNVARVKAWRSRHPGYWRKGRRSGDALQEVSTVQAVDPALKTGDFVRSPLQDVLSAQPAVLIGLIAHIVGTPLQDDIVRPPAVCYDWAKTSSAQSLRGPCLHLTPEAAVIDYEMYSRIHDCHERQGLTITQTAQTLGLHRRTVAAWLARPRYEPRRSRRAAASWIPSSRASPGCWIPIPIVLNKFSSACARKAIAAA